MSIDNDEDDQQMVSYEPVDRFSKWDVVGAVLHGLGVALSGFSQGVLYVAQKSAAAANYERQQYQNREIAFWEDERRRAAEAEMSEILALPEATDGIPESER